MLEDQNCQKTHKVKPADLEALRLKKEVIYEANNSFEISASAFIGGF